MTVYSDRVANQSPAGTFAMPVSALRFEPLVDIQARNLTEAQADITIRGGIFENTGFRLGAFSLNAPQTGHYLAENPVTPAMLGAPAILTGADHALVAMNSTVGAIAYDWRPVKTTGFVSLGAGENSLNRQEFYQGYVSDVQLGDHHLAADAAWAHAASDGGVPHGDSDFSRVNARVQLANQTSQTDLFAGYQAKFFGWPNLYTPFGSNESENLQTLLFSLNHHVNLGGGDFFEAGAYYSRNKDDYAYNRFAPVTSPAHPFQHTTGVDGAALGGRANLGDDFHLNYHAETVSDELQSTSLTVGHYHSRTMNRLVLAPEKSWRLDDGSQLIAKAGAGWDDSDHASSAVSPMVELAREQNTSALRRIYVSLATTTQLPSYTALDSSPSSGLFRGNPDLGREKSRNLEAGVQGALDGWTLQAAVFNRHDGNLVDWTFKYGVTARTANAVDIDTTGVELVARKSWSAVDFVLGYTGLTKDPDYHAAPVDASFYALNYARNRVTTALNVRLGEGVTLHFDNQVRWQAANALRTVGGSQAFIGALGVTWRPVNYKAISFDVRADNLWNSAYQEVPAVPAAPRQLSAGVTYIW
ncbi:MAG: TonB-dependent receptor [Verrucomicrobia bacterium]|nr:TonB-dependent receptor [Verrucomicrobiota bacterium]